MSRTLRPEDLCAYTGAPSASLAVHHIRMTVALRITISPRPEVQEAVQGHLQELGFQPGASLSSIYTVLAEEGYRARQRRAAEEAMARAYEVWVADPVYQADNQAELDLGFEDGLI